MANSNTAHSNHTTGDRAVDRRSTETKASTKTTEFFAYIAMVVATVVTALVVGDGDNEDGMDMFNAHQGMELITYLTIAYMIARGLAKSGSREHYSA
ncbi:hypothetical protein [Arthrobacter sp. B0490]|uniref:hypothetical protein n=1 Tax=Arthrobacter sp. B0490 TaxID=2058891 RepID=UPI001CA59113|nr:hypothetical protein [Arthrobacter sp. B0490]